MCKMLFCALFLISFVISSALPRVADQNELSLCDHDEFGCHDGSACFDLKFKCDGVRDCMDGSDEAYCSGTFGPSSDNAANSVLHRVKRQGACQKNQWQCRDGTCISFDGKCDGNVDCPDRSDETLALCRKMPCQSNWFRCTYGACVDGTAPCNGITECADNSDELLPRCRNETTEVNGKFKCQDGTIISAADHCDGTPNCPDGSDETLASCADKKCPAYLFQCAYGACVDQGADCDGKKDCADGSDESDELCDRMGKPTAATPTVTNKGSCVLPPYPKHGTYVVSNVPNAQPGQSYVSFVLTVSCQLGYGIAPDNGGMDSNGTQQVYCVNGGWFSNMPECVRFCKVTPDNSVIYSCSVPHTNGYRTCNSYEAPGTKINPRCNTPNYYSPDVLSYMTCINGSWDRVVVCKPGLVKKATNITILIKDNVEIYISEFPFSSGNDKVTVHIGADNNDKLNVNVTNSNNVDGNNANVVGNNGNVVGNNANVVGNNENVDGNNGNVDGSNANVDVNNVVTTINPINYEISEDDWRMGPVEKKNKKDNDVTLTISNRSVIIKSNDKIYFKN